MIFFCPHCDARITTGFDSSDFVHDCSQNIEASKAIQEEDVVITGNWEDFDGTGTISPQEVLRQGMHNELEGRRAAIIGFDKESETRRGKRASTHRQRAHLQFINLKNEGLN